VEFGHPLVGVGILLSFNCLLRIGEVLGIRMCDVADYGDRRMAGAPNLWITLIRTKTGPNQAVCVDERWAQRLVRFAIAFRKLHGTGKGLLEPLLGLTEEQYRAVFRRACDSLGIPAAVVPHSLRHGGATHRLIVLGQPHDAVRRHGRWVSPKSLDHYTNAPAASMMAVHAPTDSVAWGERLAKDPVVALRGAALVAATTGGSHHQVVAKLLV
jgi:integrase